MAGNGAELGRIERVEGDVEPDDAAIGESLGIAVQLAAIGGERQFVEPVAEMA